MWTVHQNKQAANWKKDVFIVYNRFSLYITTQTAKQNEMKNLKMNIVKLIQRRTAYKSLVVIKRTQQPLQQRRR